MAPLGEGAKTFPPPGGPQKNEIKCAFLLTKTVTGKPPYCTLPFPLCLMTIRHIG